MSPELRDTATELRALADRLDPPPVVPVPTRGSVLVSAERLRQVADEGHTAESDATHGGTELAWAAYCYLSRAASDGEQDAPSVPSMWPWRDRLWKPKRSRLRNLVVAAALVVAEIDRRLEAGETP